MNGSNKKFSKLSYIRNPDIEFKSHEKDEKKRSNKEEEEKCLCENNIKIVKNFEKTQKFRKKSTFMFR